jgi:hypothetical protein
MGNDALRHGESGARTSPARRAIPFCAVYRRLLRPAPFPGSSCFPWTVASPWWTLAVASLDRSRKFQCDGLGWPTPARLMSGTPSAPDVIQRQDEQGRIDLKPERSDPRLFPAEETFNGSGAGVPHPQPDDLRRSTVEEASLAKIVVFRDNHEALIARVIPHATVVSAKQADAPQMAAARKLLTQQLRQPRTQVLVE